MKPKFWKRLYLVLAVIISLGTPVTVLIKDEIHKSELATKMFFECKERLAPNAYTPHSDEWNACIKESEEYREFNVPSVAKRFLIGVIFLGFSFALFYLFIRCVVWVSKWIAKGNK